MCNNAAYDLCKHLGTNKNKSIENVFRNSRKGFMLYVEHPQ